MRATVLTSGVLFALAASLRADEALDKTVAALAVQLGADQFEKREEALTALVRLGMKAEPVVRAEMNRATDPEIRGRLLAALQMYAIEEEEAWAIAQIRKGDPFPPSKEGVGKVDLKGPASIEDFVESIRQQTGVKIELYAADATLPEFMELVSTVWSSSSSGPGAAESALWLALCAGDLTWVVDGERVVIVRLSPGVLFEKLGRELDRWSHYWIASSLMDFESGRFNYWLSTQRFLQEKGKAGGPPRDKWFQLLRNRALDAGETERNRAMALMGLGKYLGTTEIPQADVDGVFSTLACDPEAPETVRRWAARGLAWGLTGAAQDALLGILEGKEEGLQRDVVAALLEASGFYWTALARIESDEKRSERLKASLAALSASKSETLALHATVFRAWRKDPEAQAALVSAKEPADPQIRLYFFHALHQAATAPARERFLEFRSSPEPRTRAAIAAIAGSRAGGTDRGAEAELLLDFLADPEPIVRNFAATGLGTIYSGSASEPYREGKDRAIARLEELLGKEQDARVKEAIEAGLKHAKK